MKLKSSYVNTQCTVNVNCSLLHTFTQLVRSYLRHDRKVRVGGLFVRLSLLAVNTETFVCLQKCSDYKASAIPTFARTEAPDTQVRNSLL